MVPQDGLKCTILLWSRCSDMLYTTEPLLWSHYHTLDLAVCLSTQPGFMAAFSNEASFDEMEAALKKLLLADEDAITSSTSSLAAAASAAATQLPYRGIPLVLVQIRDTTMTLDRRKKLKRRIANMLARLVEAIQSIEYKHTLKNSHLPNWSFFEFMVTAVHLCHPCYCSAASEAQLGQIQR